MNACAKGKIVLAGGSGFLGRVLADHLMARGLDVVVLTRYPRRDGVSREVFWDGRTIGEWARELDGADGLINLAGRSVNCRYNLKNRRLILDSRVDSTRILGEAIVQCSRPPRVWLNAGTATIYRHNFGPAWDESGEIGAVREAKDEFSVEVATKWEQALNEASTLRTRKVALRSAMVLGLGANSVFPMLRRLVKLGLGGKMGSGQQYVSWIHQDDFCSAIDLLLGEDGISGAVNLAAPNPLTNAEMMRTLREICGAPFGLPASKWMLEFGAFFLRTETELIIKSRRVISRRLPENGFKFRFVTFRDAAMELEERLRDERSRQTN